ncbi:uncharacterized protein J8A68_004889 [[Candida] subhashii]|uniref:Essential protein Yae1 N-terminal domain-containing protein n=1 Tax=[Candida] subhashii TaxID=561895 RepID=A0A8J5QHU1_9ASCO|nr:uncharacterized protein J8A68_004889 [[Candida] subhashii]KAG7661620.1 hypothetical protein J8A68_004889 [[Candida] subhashii]
MSDINIDTDEILNIEQRYYQQGYDDGVAQSTKEQLIEGEEYGYQTGFQRFLIIGYIQGLVEYWQKNIEKYANNKSFESHLQQLKDLVVDIPIINGDEEVAEFEKRVNKARNKLRVVATLAKESWKISHLDELMKEVGGQLQVSENVDDMW